MTLPNLCILQVQKSFIEEYGCTDAPCEKSWKQGSNTTSTIMRNPLPELCREGLCMICGSILASIAKGIPCFHDFSWCIPNIHNIIH